MTKGRPTVFYTSEEVKALTEVSKQPKEQWNAAIKAYISKSNTTRSIECLWQKTYAIAAGGKRPYATAKKNRSLLVSENIPNIAPREIVATRKEIRFPYKSIKLEEGHVVISL